MSFTSLPLSVREIAERELTAKQLEAFRYELAGWSLQRIADRYDIAKQSAAGRIEGAHRRLRKAGVRQDQFGRWYIEEEVAA